MASDKSSAKRWDEDETILALHLYFQLPFGKLHSGNPEIQQLAKALGRSSNSVAMKLCNFASLDPKVTESGRKGLSGASKLDRAIYANFAEDWTALVSLAESKWHELTADLGDTPKSVKEDRASFEAFIGPSAILATALKRRGQDFFRRAVLAIFEEACCVTGIADARLLIASHIKPWREDESHRHNPANGLLLSATFDRAFDSGLITIDQKQRIHISKLLAEHENIETRAFFRPFSNAQIRQASRFHPEPEFIEWHNKNCFLDSL